MAGGMERVMPGFEAGAVVLACGDQKGELLWKISTR